LTGKINFINLTFTKPSLWTYTLISGKFWALHFCSFLPILLLSLNSKRNKVIARMILRKTS